MVSDSRVAMSFGAIADDYDRLRPPPPQEAIDWLVPAGADVVVDLGAGTGMFTRALSGRARDVVAVEPDARMREFLAERTSGVRIVAGAAEAIPLPDGCADGLFVSTAWHWMDADRAVPEIARVLRPGGRFGVLWTSRDRSVGWVQELDRIGYPGVLHSPEDPARRRTPSEMTEVTAALFDDVCEDAFLFSKRMSIDDVIALLGTYSKAITASEADRSAQFSAARDLLARVFPGADRVDLPMRARCWRAQRR
jgi:SAM-dependent methyltransferase